MPRRNNSQRLLDDHLVLHMWLNSHFGYKTTRDLLNDVKNMDEGFNPDGYSPICEFLIPRAEPNSAIERELRTYDDNIKRHLSFINDKRTQPIVLRYFQYLTLLYTEIFLDWKFNRPAGLLQQLNTFVQKRNDVKAPGDPMDVDFTEADLEKLAFWMATGAGKTLIMHINYHQFLHYSKEELDHIVLITPNEGLSEQHMREMASSNIRSERFSVEKNKSPHTRNTVQVIEITKLVEEKTGEGESVEVEAFEGKNLILVDEGHKGSGGEVWRKIRDRLGETGFTFEYSATFGQALAAANNADLIEEYGKAIVFDYSYRYFYDDGYGKNFRILNVRQDEESQTETLLLANLLTFYEQRRYFKQNTEDVRAYELESPLWAFVGSKVNAVYTENRRARSDVLNVIRFLHSFLKNEGNWAINAIEKILSGNSGLSDDNNTDIFHTRLNYLKIFSETPEHIYRDILNEVFHTDTSGALHLQDIRNAQGEIALKTTHGRENFGLIYIGDTSAFKKLVENDNAGIETDSEDVLTESLFNNINTFDSPINILIGAKKFIEGWDSWRVTAMGLLNIGRQEGSQIIQLFGRGVRLRGKNMSLKRSAVLDGKHPLHISLLETLNIFAVRANFMAQFRDYLMREGIQLDEPIQLTIEIRRNDVYHKKRLFIPKVTPYHEGAKGQCEPLKVLTGTIITHTTQSIDIVGSNSQRGIHTERAEGTLPTYIPEPSLALVDWEKIYLQLIAYKHEKGYHNLIFDTTILREILNPNKPVYKLTVMDKSEVVPTSTVELERLEELILTLLRKYIAKYYRIIQKRWNDDRIRIRRLGEETEDENNFPDWTVHVPRTEAQEVQPEIENLMESEEIYGPGLTVLPNVYSERHLYQPLLTNEEHLYRSLLSMGMGNNLWRTTPPALEDSERDFVEDLNQYLRQHHRKQLRQKEVFLLRNQSRGKGVGFYENEGFYPDFILWILDGVKQRVIFIEPHGMVHEDINEDNDKLTLFKRLRELSYERFRFEHVQMDAFVISRTSLSDLISRYPDEDRNSFAEKWHILFRTDDPTYLEPIFQGPNLDSPFL
ncbi:restriction endonuclease subunit R [Candidatus Poribacteria bacterium]|nr:MAG: restriction endonuclease subunit R [Candidatus Poribacteria bacterium]